MPSFVAAENESKLRVGPLTTMKADIVVRPRNVIRVMNWPSTTIGLSEPTP